MKKKYTEEDLRHAFYKGREQGILPDEQCSKLFIRPTFNGYLRELDGVENPHENWAIRVQGLIDNTDYDLETWKMRNELRTLQKSFIKQDKLEKVEEARNSMKNHSGKNSYSLEHILNKVNKTEPNDYFFVKENELRHGVIGELYKLKITTIFIGSMNPDEYQYKIFKGLGVKQSSGWSEITRDSFSMSWAINNPE